MPIPVLFKCFSACSSENLEWGLGMRLHVHVLLLCMNNNILFVGIVEYMLEQAQPASRQISSKKELDNFLKYQRDPVFITVSADSASDAYATHDSLANAGRESPLTFVHSFSNEVASSLGLQQNSGAILTPQR